ncbi:DNA-binding response regulator [Marinilabiliaceae bacterium JC017]|nr:DNA-binding response regulator [Marinilabiliaceae bacterium JC017]
MNGFKILVVDDLVSNLQIMVLYIKKANPSYTIYQSKSSINALEIAKKTQPDLVITDWDMPEMNGIELIRALKKEETTCNIPVIMATGVMLTSDDLKLALEAGAVDYIRKPIEPVELTARIHSALMIASYHKRNIEMKNKELAENALFLVKSNEFNLDISKKLQEFADVVNLHREEKELLDVIINEMAVKAKSDSHQRFHLAFQSVYPHFNKNLLNHFPELTAAEIKLCSFVRMGLSIKDIASVLYQNPDSIKVARSRLRKKLNLDTGQNLEAFLTAY